MNKKPTPEWVPRQVLVEKVIEEIKKLSATRW
jgi:hypothetical protein